MRDLLSFKFLAAETRAYSLSSMDVGGHAVLSSEANVSPYFNVYSTDITAALLSQQM